VFYDKYEKFYLIYEGLCGCIASSRQIAGRLRKFFQAAWAMLVSVHVAIDRLPVSRSFSRDGMTIL
jgi:hypothetical protein